MRDMLHVHDSELEKSEIWKTITDIRPSSDQFTGYWGVLLDKWYTGIEAEVRSVIRKKKPVGGVLTLADRQENEAKASDRVIVGNYFEWQGLLWGVVSSKYRWSEDSYDSIFQLTAVLTNVQIKSHPLCSDYERTYERYLKLLHDIADTTLRKWQNAKAAYRRKRQRMMQRSTSNCVDAHADAAAFSGMMRGNK